MFDFHIEISEQMPPSSAVVYAKSMGLRAFALVSTVDMPFSASDAEDGERRKEISPLTASLLARKKQINELAVYYNVQVFFGIKLRHIPPALLENTIAFYRSLKIPFIGVHGETVSDIVEHGTNFSAVMGHADIIFNAGLIDKTCMELAQKNNVFLEISTHPKHAYTNAHIAKLAHEYGAKLALGSQAKTLEDIHSPDMQKAILKGACIENEHSYELLQKIQHQSNEEFYHGRMSKM